MNTSFIFASIGVFLIVILLLVVILLVAKKFLFVDDYAQRERHLPAFCMRR